MEMSLELAKRFEKATPEIMEKLLAVLTDQIILHTAVYKLKFPERYAEWVKTQTLGDVWSDNESKSEL